MTCDPTMPNDELDDLWGIAATDAWLDAVGRGCVPAGDVFATAMNGWLTDLSADYKPAPVPRPLASRSARGAVAVAVAAMLFVGAGTAAAIPGNPVHHIIFGNGHVQRSPDAPDYGPAEQALARASDAITPLLPGGVVTAAQRSDALRLIADAAAAIATLPAGAERTDLDARRVTLLRELTGLRMVDTSARSVETGAPALPRPVSTLPGAGGSNARPAPAASSAADPASSPNDGSSSGDGAMPAPSTESTADQDSATAPPPTDPSSQDSASAANDSGTG